MINHGSKKEPSVNKMLNLFISKCYIITYFKKNVLQKDTQAHTAAEQWALLKLDVKSREWHMWNMKILGPRGKVKLSIMSLTIISSQLAAAEQWNLLCHISYQIPYFPLCLQDNLWLLWYVVSRWALSTVRTGSKHLCCFASIRYKLLSSGS